MRALPLRPQQGPSGDLRSWQFCAYNSNKRSIALDLYDGGDREVFESLVKLAGFVYESGVPGTLAAAGYAHDDLAALNERIIHVQVTPFGLDGPRSADPASELSLAALGGPANMQGIFERAPVKASIAQAWRHAGAESAAAGLMAHARMRATGSAQHVGVSAQAAMTWTLLNAMETHAICGRDFTRSGTVAQLAVPLQMRYLTQDGWAIGVARGVATGRLLDWYIEEGLADESWHVEEWDTYDLRAAAGEPISRTFDELYEGHGGTVCEPYERRTPAAFDGPEGDDRAGPHGGRPRRVRALARARLLAVCARGRRRGRRAARRPRDHRRHPHRHEAAAAAAQRARSRDPEAARRGR